MSIAAATGGLLSDPTFDTSSGAPTHTDPSNSTERAEGFLSQYDNYATGTTLVPSSDMVLFELGIERGFWTRDVAGVQEMRRIQGMGNNSLRREGLEDVVQLKNDARAVYDRLRAERLEQQQINDQSFNNQRLVENEVVLGDGSTFTERTWLPGSDFTPIDTSEEATRERITDLSRTLRPVEDPAPAAPSPAVAPAPAPAQPVERTMEGDVLSVLQDVPRWAWIVGGVLVGVRLLR